MNRTRLFLSFISLLCVSNISAADRFWVGDSGNWSDVAHWSAASGGVGGAGVPGTNDNAIFDLASGLTAISIVTVDIAVVIRDFDFSTVLTTFDFDNPGAVTFEVGGSISGNTNLVAFTGAWVEINMDSAPPGNSILSNGTLWTMDFRISSSSIALTDDLVTTGSIFIDAGGLSLPSRTLTCFDFNSNVTTNRTIDVSNSIVNCTGSNWTIDPTNLTWTAPGVTVNLTHVPAAAVIFTGGGLSYDTVRCNTFQPRIFSSNTFGLFQSTNSFQINNGTTQLIDSLVAIGTCATPFTIESVNAAGPSASIQKTGFPAYNASNLIINNVDALSPGPEVYTLQLSDTTNGTSGWTIVATTYYWIGDAGNWSDANHWSLTSGGGPNGCIPTLTDSVYFDAASFTLLNQTVTVDIFARFGYMDWTNSTNSPTLKLDTNILSYGDVNLHPNLSVSRGNISSKFEFARQAVFNPDASAIDCNISIYMIDVTDSLLLSSFLDMSDSSSIYLVSGEMYTQGNDINSGSIFVLTLLGLPPLDSLKLLDLGSSNINLIQTFNAQNATANFTFNSGTSNIFIGALTAINSIITEDLVFYDMTLDFQELTAAQIVTGNNTFNRFEIIAGSHVVFDSTTIQTISDSLILDGTCIDSIYLSSSNASFPASFSKTISTDVVAACLDLTSVGASGAGLTTYFSTDNGSNTGWTFDASASTTAGYTFSGGFCFGDTVLFNNTSTAFSGNVNDITSIWYFNDGSTGYYANPPIDSTWITYVPDTNMHVFTASGDIEVTLVTTYTNFCTDTITDTVHINQPSIFLTPSQLDSILCTGEQISFEASSATSGATFEFFVNGVSQNVPSVNDTIFITTSLTTGDTVSVLSYENGCASDTMPAFTYTVHALPVFSWLSSDADTTICATDSVFFTASGTDVYQYLINGSSVTSFISSGLYSTPSLLNNDAVTLIGRNDSTQCVDTLSAMIFTVNPLPITALSESVGGNVICAGDAVTFTGSGATTYEFFVDGVSQGAPGASTWLTTTLVTGDTVTVLGYSTQGCIQFAPEFYTYSVNPLPNVVMTLSDADTTICSGEIVTFNVTGASIYEFFINGVSVQGPSAVTSYNTTGLANGDYLHVVGDFSGCTKSSDTATFIVLTSPTTTLLSDDVDAIICAGTTVTFTAGGATNYEFFIDGVSQGAPSATNTFVTSALLNGETVTVNGESNTCVVTQGITFTVLALPTVGLFSSDPNDSICQGDLITLTGANASQYELFINALSQGAPQASPTFTPTLAPGSNSIFLIGTAANGCTDTSATMLNIVVTALPVLVLTSSDGDDIICAGESVTFTGTGSDLYQFLIDGVTQGAMSPTNTLTTTNLLNGQVISINGTTLGCPGTSNTLTYTVNPIPTIVLASSDVDNVFCIGDLVTFTASGATNYEFFVDGVSQGPSSPVNTINSAAFIAGTYNVSVIGEASNCSGNASSTITVNSLPVPVLTSSDFDNTICIGESVTYTATGGTFYEFQVNGTSQGPASPITTFTTTTLANADIVSVIVSSSSGCIDSISMAPITVNPTPIVTIASSDLDFIICSGESVTFTGSGATDYEFFINGVSQGPASPVTTFTTTGINNNDEITIIGTTSGCSATSITLTFTVNSPPLVIFVNNGTLDICTGENTDLAASGASNYQFFVNGIPIGPFGPGSTFTSPLNNGDVVTVDGESNGCISSAASSYTFVVNTYPTLVTTSSDADNIICIDEQVDFTASGAMMYLFELNGLTLQSGPLSLYGLNTLADGDVISITGFNGDCASSIETYTFTVNSMPLTLTYSPSSMVCENELVTFTANGADEYEFFLNGASTGAMSTTNVYSSSTLNDLDEVTFTGYSNTTLCFQDFADYIIMNVIDEPVITPPSPIDFCDGDSVILMSNLLYGNQWLVDGSPIASETDTSYIAYTSGLYTLEVNSGGLGDVWSFGVNATGAFGNGDNLNNSEPTQALTTTQFDEISSGSDFLLAVSTSGDVYAWGENSSGQLGDGTYTNTNLPNIVPTLVNIKTIATTESSSMAVSNTGDVSVWGNNAEGQLGVGSTAVINFPMNNASMANTDSIAGGKTHFVILKNDGTVWAVGNNDYGQLGQGDLIGSMIPVQVAGLANIVSVGAGEYHSFAIDILGDLYVWGNNGSGQLGMNDLTNRLSPDVSPLRNVVNAQGGANHSAFLTSTDKVYTTGGNAYGQLGLGDFIDVLSPVEALIQGAQMISTGQYTTLVRRNDNSIFGFGNNTEDQLSSSTGSLINTPEHITDLDGVEFIEAGKSTSHVLYLEEKLCVSQSVVVTVNTVPVVTITANMDTLTTIAGASYQWYINGSAIPGATGQSHVTSSSGNYTVEVTFANGCVGTSTVYIHSMVAILELGLESLRIYPNPTNYTLYLVFDKQLTGATKIEVVDQTGRIVLESNLSEGEMNYSLDVSTLNNGLYILSIRTSNGEIHEQFMKATL